MRYRLFLAAAAAVMAAPLGVQAADLPAMPTKAPVVAPVPYFNWTGPYIGINGGGGWGTSDHSGISGFDVSGGLAGGTIGFNYQLDRWVWGLEGDLDWAHVSGNSGPINGVTYDSYLQWLGTARGRVGYAFDRFLPYVTGGVAVGGVKGSMIGPPLTILSGTDTQTGWTVGAGIEYGITPSLSLKAEYLYVDLGSSTPIPGDTVDFKSHNVRAGLNWRFGWDGPVHH